MTNHFGFYSILSGSRKPGECRLSCYRAEVGALPLLQSEYAGYDGPHDRFIKAVLRYGLVVE